MNVYQETRGCEQWNCGEGETKLEGLGFQRSKKLNNIVYESHRKKVLKCEATNNRSPSFLAMSGG